MDITDIVALICGLILIGLLIAALRQPAWVRATQGRTDYTTRASNPYPHSGYGSIAPRATGGYLGGYPGLDGRAGCDCG